MQRSFILPFFSFSFTLFFQIIYFGYLKNEYICLLNYWLRVRDIHG